MRIRQRFAKVHEDLLSGLHNSNMSVPERLRILASLDEGSAMEVLRWMVCYVKAKDEFPDVKEIRNAVEAAKRIGSLERWKI